MSDRDTDLKIEQGAVLQPRGEYESIVQFYTRMHSQKMCSFSIPPRSRHETLVQFFIRLNMSEDM